MKRPSFLHRAIAVLVLLVFFAPIPAHADTAAQGVVRGLYAQLVSTMKQGRELGFEGRYKKLDPVIKAAFNLPLMARMATGPSWANASAQEQDDLIKAFSDFSVATYASRFAAYDGEQFTVIGEKPSVGGVIVETSMKPSTGDAITLNYLMRADDKGNYRIVDVMMNGTISELATRRAEFSSIARRDGIQALVNSLSGKSKQMGAS
ncbi:MAG: ABC transporter substrate-binding protein [Alphaproteobacteria bacterium]|nr:ABC transporter substrate-binding protein [Alphaproteobacteria bacterium]